MNDSVHSTDADGAVDENPTYDSLMQAYQASGNDTERFR
jgi:hypothetical protein